jgi:hypothetical protein
MQIKAGESYGELQNATQIGPCIPYKITAVDRAISMVVLHFDTNKARYMMTTPTSLTLRMLAPVCALQKVCRS